MRDANYWRDRYASIKDLRVVGHAGKTTEVNQREYTSAGKRFLELVARDVAPARSTAASVLDIGYGLGHYARLCHLAGFHSYVGLDLAAPPGPSLGPGYTYRKADIGVPLHLGQRFDLVLLIDVLFHVTDDARFGQTLANVAKHAAGMVYVTGLFRDDVKTAPHVVHRSLDRIRRYLGDAELVDMEPWRDTQIARLRVRSR